MTAEWSLPAWAAVATLGAIVAVLSVALFAALKAARRAAARAAEASAAAHALSEDLRVQMSAVEARLAARPPTHEPGRAEQREYVITRLGDPREAAAEDGTSAAPMLDGPLFADLVLRESLVQAASLAAGLRRAFAPAHLNKVRFEMRRELKRSRKQRRADLRQARRDYETRDRDRNKDVAA